MSASQISRVTWKNVPTRTITAGGVEFAYRELGTDNPGTPVVFLIHLAAVLDNWDPRIVDGFAAKHRVITFDNRGVGASSGAPATSMEEMARDAITFIKAMGLDQVDLVGFSMGGMIAQEIVLMEPRLVRKMIITGTGPAGGEGISQVARVTYLDMIRGWLTFQDPKQFLFFTRTHAGIRAGKEFLQRLKERSENRDKAITVAALQAQLKALRRWGAKEPADLSKVHHPVPVGEGTDEPLRRRIRAQGNFIEYVPLALIALGLVEAHEAPTWMVLSMGCVLAFGRLLHVIGMLCNVAALRGFGMILTYLSLVLAAVRLLAGATF